MAHRQDRANRRDGLQLPDETVRALARLAQEAELETTAAVVSGPQRHQGAREGRSSHLRGRAPLLIVRIVSGGPAAVLPLQPLDPAVERPHPCNRLIPVDLAAVVLSLRLLI